jgi:hypothetical protein
VCFRKAVFFEAADIQQRLEALLGSSLSWWWSSKRDGAPAAGKGVQDTRDSRLWTRLEAATLVELRAELLGEDVNGNGRFLTLVGFDDSQPPGDEESGSVQGALADFAQGECGPVRMAIVQLGDTNTELFFVPHVLSPEVKALLSEWQISRSHARERPYSELRSARLEHLFPLSESDDFG